MTLRSGARFGRHRRDRTPHKLFFHHYYIVVWNIHHNPLVAWFAMLNNDTTKRTRKEAINKPRSLLYCTEHSHWPLLNFRLRKLCDSAIKVRVVEFIKSDSDSNLLIRLL